MADINPEQRELMEKWFESIQSATKEMGPLASEERALAESTKKTRDGFESFRKATIDVTKSFGNAGKSFFEAAEGAGKYGKASREVSGSLGDLAGKIPYVGKALGGLVKAIGGVVAATLEQNDALVKSYQALSDFGAIDTRGVEGIFEDLQKLQLATSQIGQMEGALKKLQPELAALGGSAAQGRKQFIDVMSNIIGTDLEVELRKLGYTQEQISDSAAQYLAREARLGNTQTKNVNQLTQETGKYLKELQELTMLTGLSREEQQRIRDQQLAEVRFNDYIQDLKARGETKAAERLQNFSVAIEKFAGKETAAGFREQLVNYGAVVGDASVKFEMATRGAGYRLGKAVEAGTIDVPRALKELGRAGTDTKKSFEAVVRAAPDVAGELGLTNEAMRGFAQMLGITSQDELDRMMKEIAANKGLINEEIKRSLAERDLRLMMDKLNFALGEKVIPMLTKLTEVARNLGKVFAKMIDKFGPFLGFKNLNLSALFVDDLEEATETIAEETQKLPKILEERNKLEKQLADAAADRLKKEQEYEKNKDSGMAFKLKTDADIAKAKEKELKQKLNELKEQEKAVKSNIQSLEETRKQKLGEIQSKAAGARKDAAATDPRRAAVEGEGKKPLSASELNQSSGVSATGVNGNTVITTETGEKEIRKGGTISWRNNNPGNMRMSDFSKAQGAIGEAGGFAVFPTAEAGEKAREKLLFEAETYKNKSIAEAMNRYAPPSENNTQAYIDSLVKATGANPNTPLSKLTPDQRQKMLNAMKQFEGWKEGTIEKAATGGIFSGPTSGYPVMLHGKEIVIPMKDVQSALSANSVDKEELPTSTVSSTSTTTSNNNENISELVAMLSSKMDEMINRLTDSNRTQEELLNYARV